MEVNIKIPCGSILFMNSRIGTMKDDNTQISLRQWCSQRIVGLPMNQNKSSWRCACSVSGSFPILRMWGINTREQNSIYSAWPMFFPLHAGWKPRTFPMWDWCKGDETEAEAARS